MTTYRVFKRSATGWASFGAARKRVVRTGLTLAEARDFCEQWNAERTPAQCKAGLKYEYERE